MRLKHEPRPAARRIAWAIQLTKKAMGPAIITWIISSPN